MQFALKNQNSCIIIIVRYNMGVILLQEVFVF
jgi:hypothetical protein